MPPASPAPGSVQDWLQRANGKLVLAQQPLPPGGFFEDLCFFTQQAAELAIKAVYQKQGWRFPFVHDLGRLLDGLQDQGMTVPPDVQAADALTMYAAETRYPGAYTPITRRQNRRGCCCMG